MTIFFILFGLALGYFISQIIYNIVMSANNFIEIKTESLVVTSKYTKKALDNKGYETTKYITTFIYKGKCIKIDNSRCYNEAIVGEKINVKMKLWYKKGKLRKFKIIDFK